MTGRHLVARFTTNCRNCAAIIESTCCDNKSLIELQASIYIFTRLNCSGASLEFTHTPIGHSDTHTFKNTRRQEH